MSEVISRAQSSDTAPEGLALSDSAIPKFTPEPLTPLTETIRQTLTTIPQIADLRRREEEIERYLAYLNQLLRDLGATRDPETRDPETRDPETRAEILSALNLAMANPETRPKALVSSLENPFRRLMRQILLSHEDPDSELLGKAHSLQVDIHNALHPRGR